jgi:proteasome beta subunit
MTLILGLICADGVVLASDSQATYMTGGQQVKGNITKLVPQWNNVVWAASGNVGVAQHVSRMFREHTALQSAAYFENRNADTALKEICEALRPSLHSYFTALLNLSNSNPWTSFIFCGWVKDGPLLFELGADLIASDHREAGYAAIGSGDVFPYFALASLEHHRVRERTLSMATLIAHRIVNDAINVAAYGLGPPVQMITVPRGGPAEVRDDIAAIQDGVREWQQIERDALEKYVDTAPSEQQAPTSE